MSRKNLAILSILKAVATDTRPRLDALTETQIRWVIAAGLGPLLHHLSENAPASSASADSALVLSADLTSRVLSGQIVNSMTEIIDACKPHTLLTLLKGISICEQHYPKPHLRLMGDIDFLVSQAAYPSVEATLLELGYRKQSQLPASFYQNHHHGMPLLHPDAGMWVEIHTGLFPPRTALGQDPLFALHHIQSQVRSSQFAGRDVNRLSTELQVVYTASHWALTLSGQFQPIRSIVPMLDTIYLLKNDGGSLNWDHIIGWLDNSLACRYLYLMLTWLDRYNLIDIDREVLKKLCSVQKTLGKPSLKIMHKMIDDYVVGGNDFGRILTSDNLTIVWKTLLSTHSPQRNLALLPWNILFPPNNPKRYNAKFQLGRIKSALGLNR